MSAPVFDPKAWCLLYFSVPDSEALPIHPGEFFVAEPREVTLNLVSNLASEIPQIWYATTPAEVYDALAQALAHDIFTCAGKMFTVHKASLLERLLNWKAMARASEDLAPAGRPRLMTPVVDLVEEFHKPAILTYQHRKDFGAALVNFWLGGPTTSTQTTLWRLCHIL